MRRTSSPRKLVWADPVLMAEDSETGTQTTEIQPPGDRDANLVSSELENGRHSPVLDIDFRAWLYPSSTPGCFHLYLDGVEMEWEAYKKLLMALGDAGILGKGYVEHSLERKQTVVRRPGHMKIPKDPKTSEEPF